MKTPSQLTEGITPKPFDQQAADLEAFRADSEALAGLIKQLDEALPDFKGLPAPVDWARLALQKIIEDRKKLLGTVQDIFGDWLRGQTLHAGSPRYDQARAALKEVLG